MDPVSRAQNSGNSAKKAFGTPFKKGQSGNPGGRPKKKPLTEIYEEVFSDPDVREKVKKQVIATMTRKGMAGVLERREAGERIEGKVVQSAEVAVTINMLTDEELLQRMAKLLEAK